MAILASTCAVGRLADGIDLGRLAAHPPVLGGGPRALCEVRGEVALEDSLRAGGLGPITWPISSGPGEDVDPSTSVVRGGKNFAQFANEGGRYDDLLEYLRAQRLG